MWTQPTVLKGCPSLRSSAGPVLWKHGSPGPQDKVGETALPPYRGVPVSLHALGLGRASALAPHLHGEGDGRPSDSNTQNVMPVNAWGPHFTYKQLSAPGF